MSSPTALFVVEHCSDPESSRWRLVYVPAIDQYTQARDSGEIELMALELISLSTGAALTYRYCADQLTELLGPLASAGGVGNQPKKNHRRRKRPEGWSVSSPGKVLPEVVEGPFELPPSTSGPNQSAGAVGNQP